MNWRGHPVLLAVCWLLLVVIVGVVVGVTSGNEQCIGQVIGGAGAAGVVVIWALCRKPTR
jgi:hypothetical protein